MSDERAPQPEPRQDEVEAVYRALYGEPDPERGMDDDLRDLTAKTIAAVDAARGA